MFSTRPMLSNTMQISNNYGGLRDNEMSEPIQTKRTIGLSKGAVSPFDFCYRGNEGLQQQ